MQLKGHLPQLRFNFRVQLVQCVRGLMHDAKLMLGHGMLRDVLHFGHVLNRTRIKEVSLPGLEEPLNRFTLNL